MSTQTPSRSRAVPTTDWRRLSARMLLVHPIIEVARFAPALLVVMLAGRGGGQSWWGLLSVVVPVLLGMARWLTTSYRTTPEQLQLRTGLLNRNTLTAPLDRVRTVDLAASPLHRLLGLATVTVGTGSHTPIRLDALARPHAQALHEALLSRSAEHAGTASADSADSAGNAAPTDSTSKDAAAPAESILARFSPSWLRFAPFTLAGVVAVGAVLVFAAQFLEQLSVIVEGQAVGAVIDEIDDQPWWLIGLVLTVGAAVVLTTLSLVMYAVNYGGFRLSRRPDGTLHVVRGLLTTRATTLEERRLRGAVLREPCLMRPVHGAKADALVAGSFTSDDQGASALLMPPAPRALVVEVLERVVDDPEPWQVALRPHGRAATRRRYVRAVMSSLLVPVLALVVDVWIDLPGWLLAASMLPVLASLAVGRARARALGHALTEHYLVARSGVFPRRRAALRRDGIIGWSRRRTLFQRRVGLVTLRALTAAAPGHIDIIDIPEADARRLMAQVGPAALADLT